MCFRQLSSHWKLLLLRSLCDGSAAGCFYWSMAFFPLTELGFLLQTQAVFAKIVAFIILRRVCFVNFTNYYLNQPFNQFLSVIVCVQKVSAKVTAFSIFTFAISKGIAIGY